MGRTPKEILSLARNTQRAIAIMDGNVYDLTDYISGMFKRFPWPLRPH